MNANELAFRLTMIARHEVAVLATKAGIAEAVAEYDADERPAMRREHAYLSGQAEGISHALWLLTNDETWPDMVAMTWGTAKAAAKATKRRALAAEDAEDAAITAAMDADTRVMALADAADEAAEAAEANARATEAAAAAAAHELAMSREELADAAYDRWDGVTPADIGR